jgi:hypothetical protein
MNDDADITTAQAEREAMSPDEGYRLVHIDYASRPGDALSARGTYDSLAAVEMPPETSFSGYVVYDSDGVAYDREDVAAAQTDE